MSLFRRHKRFAIQLTIFLLLSASVNTGLYVLFSIQSNNYLTDQQEHANHNYNAVLASYKLIAQTLHRQALSQPEVIQLIDKASRSGQVDKSKLRKALYQQLLPAYQGLANESNLKQIHFRFADGTSFLRMHSPNEFGDQLLPIRPAIRIVQESRKPLITFESGRHGSGFRYIFPLLSGNRLIGSVEISLSFEAIKSELEQLFPGEYLLLVARKDVENTVYGSQRTPFAPSPFGAAFMLEQLSEAPHSGHIAPAILQHLTDQAGPRLKDRLVLGKQAATIIRQDIYHFYTVHLLPLQGADGTIAGYLASFSGSRIIDTYFQNMLLASSGSLVLLALVQLVITQLMRRGKELRTANRMFQATIDALPYPFYVVDTTSYRIRICNNRASDGKLPSNMTCHLLTHKSITPCENIEHPCPMNLVMEKGGPVIVEHLHYDSNGNPRHVEVHGYPIFGDDGKIEYFIEYSIDITERKETESRLVSMAESDHLTGCHNRRKLYQLLEIEIKRAKRNEHPLALLMLDIDHFKLINDQFGHDRGDIVLKHVTATVQDALRQTDMLGRFGGEEFLAILPESDLRQATSIAERLQKSLVQNPPEGVGVVTISIGVSTLWPGDGSDSLVKRADEALYRAKQNGRNRYEVESNT